jgi:hypothetical protein
MTNTNELQVVEEKINGMRDMLAQTQVTTDEEAADVAEKVDRIHKLGQFIRQEMERYTKPAQEIINNARARFLPYENECKEAEVALKSKAKVYLMAQEEERARKEAQIAKQLEAGRIKETTAIRKMESVGEEKKTVATETGAKLTLKTVRRAYIVNPDLVPDEYWVIDETKAKKVALAGVQVPGVEVREEKEMSR